MGYGLKSQALSLPQAQAAEAVAPQAVSQPAANGPQNEALRLVYEYRLPGTDRDMLDMVGSQESIMGPSPWAIECVSDERCDVSFIKRDGADSEPLYEFDVDLAAKSVTPAPETEQKLASVSLAQNRVD